MQLNKTFQHMYQPPLFVFIMNEPPAEWWTLAGELVSSEMVTVTVTVVVTVPSKNISSVVSEFIDRAGITGTEAASQQSTAHITNIASYHRLPFLLTVICAHGKERMVCGSKDKLDIFTSGIVGRE